MSWKGAGPLLSWYQWTVKLTQLDFFECTLMLFGFLKVELLLSRKSVY